MWKDAYVPQGRKKKVLPRKYHYIIILSFLLCLKTTHIFSTTLRLTKQILTQNNWLISYNTNLCNVNLYFPSRQNHPILKHFTVTLLWRKEKSVQMAVTFAARPSPAQVLRESGKSPTHHYKYIIQTFLHKSCTNHAQTNRQQLSDKLRHYCKLLPLCLLL